MKMYFSKHFGWVFFVQISLIFNCFSCQKVMERDVVVMEYLLYRYALLVVSHCHKLSFFALTRPLADITWRHNTFFELRARKLIVTSRDILQRVCGVCRTTPCSSLNSVEWLSTIVGSLLPQNPSKMHFCI